MTETRISGAKLGALAGTDVDQSTLTDVRARIESSGGSIVMVPAELPFERAHPTSFVGLIVLDAFPVEETPDPKAVQVVREFMLADKPVAAIGSGVSLLAAADAVPGRSVASPPELETQVRDLGGEISSAAIHVDDKLITARSAADLHVFLDRVVRVFGAQVEERSVDLVSEQSFPASDPPPGPGAIGAGGTEADPDRDAGTDIRY